MRELILRQAIVSAALAYQGGWFAGSHGVLTAIRCYCTRDWNYCREDFCAVVRVEFARLWEAQMEKQEDLRNEIANTGEC